MSSVLRFVPFRLKGFPEDKSKSLLDKILPEKEIGTKTVLQPSAHLNKSARGTLCQVITFYITPLLLIYPDGRLLPRRWRWLVGVLVLVNVLNMIDFLSSILISEFNAAKPLP